MRRNRVEMLIDILRACSYQRLKATHIIYKSNVNASSLNPFLKQLIEAKLINMKSDYSSSPVFYTATKKGIEMVKTYDQLVCEIGEVRR